MKFNLGSVLSIAARAMSAVPTAVAAAQAAQKAFGAGSGADKKAAVLDLVKAELSAAELVAGHDFANDPDVVAAAGAVIDAVAAFQKVIAHKAIGASV